MKTGINIKDDGSFPLSRGLYNPENEHDACGVGMIVNIRGNKSHKLVDDALKVLENMKHRGAEGADNKTGDGAGIMVMNLYCFRVFLFRKREDMVPAWCFFLKMKVHRHLSCRL